MDEADRCDPGTQEPHLGNLGPAPSLRDTPGLVTFWRDNDVLGVSLLNLVRFWDNNAQDDWRRSSGAPRLTRLLKAQLHLVGCGFCRFEGGSFASASKSCVESMPR